MPELATYQSVLFVFPVADCKVASAVKSSNPFVALSTTGEKVTPQEALLQTMAAMHQKVRQTSL